MAKRVLEDYDSSSVHSTARRLAFLGYHVIPVAPGQKMPTDREWTSMRLSPFDIDRLITPDTDSNLGLLLSTEVYPKCFIIAIDVDQDDSLLIERIRLAFPGLPPGKRGKKGITFFGRSIIAVKGKKFTRKDDAGKRINCVEILGVGNQTVLPPSIHPDGPTYEWVGGTLAEMNPEELPLLDACALAEIEMAVKEPDKPIFGLNIMTPSGGEAGTGTVHNTVLTAVASLVSSGWEDEPIVARCMRAVRRVDVAAGLPAERPGYEQVVRRMIEDARKKGFHKQRKQKHRHAAAMWLIHKWKGPNRIFDRNERIVVYDNGWYKTLSLTEVRKTIAQCEDGDVALEHSDLEAASLTALDYAPTFPSVKAARRVCFMNGTFDMMTGEFGKWSPDDYLISQLPIEYDAEATCPTYETFVRRCFSGQDEDDIKKAVDVFEEFVGHTLFECLDYHKFLVIKGDPQTGKSTLAAVAEMLHSSDAVSHVAIQQIGDERYTVEMVDKLLNISTEVAATSHAADSILKAVTGNDSIAVRRLYQHPFSTHISARLMVCCNELFRTRDTSGGVERRMLILRCGDPIPEEERDESLRLRLKDELPGIFNRMVKAWQRLYNRRRFEPPSTHYQELMFFAEENNVPLLWVKACTHQGAKMEDPDYRMPADLRPTASEELFENFRNWARAKNFKDMSAITWGTKLGQINKRLKQDWQIDRPVWQAGKMRRVWNLNLISHVTY